LAAAKAKTDDFFGHNIWLLSSFFALKFLCLLLALFETAALVFILYSIIFFPFEIKWGWKPKDRTTQKKLTWSRNS
jgi:hypothetical protein